MTYEEALKSVIEDGINLGGCGDYIDPEALPLCAEALEKQIPKTPINVIYDGQYIEYWNCPHCHIQHSNEITRFCDNCGQALI